MTTMSVVEIGNVVEGVVTGITNFGAFIQLPDGKTGLCHISEIADNYVKSVADYLKETQQVKVKVISVDDKGKVSLSIRQAEPKPASEGVVTEAPSRPAPKFNNASRERKDEPREFKPRGGSKDFNNGPREFKGGGKPYTGNKSSNFSRNERKSPENFEDMINMFMKDSDDKLKSIKKPAKSTRRGNGYNR